jgi:hypothetical protein
MLQEMDYGKISGVKIMNYIYIFSEHLCERYSLNTDKWVEIKNVDISNSLIKFR